MSYEPTCEDRIDGELAREMDTLKCLWTGYQSGSDESVQDSDGDDIGTWHEYGLSLDYIAPETFGENQDEGYVRFQLSWGGPSDEVRFYFSGAHLDRVEYWFMDWFDGAHRRLTGEHLDLMTEVWDMWGDCGMVDAWVETASDN